MTIQTTTLESHYPIVLPMGGERVIRAEMHSSGYYGIPLVMGTWDCECDEGYIHWAERHGGEDHCVVCDTYEEDMPESGLYGIAQNIDNCRPGFMSDEERAVFLSNFEAQGFGELMRIHFAANQAVQEARHDAKIEELERLYGHI